MHDHEQRGRFRLVLLAGLLTDQDEVLVAAEQLFFPSVRSGSCSTCPSVSGVRRWPCPSSWELSSWSALQDVGQGDTQETLDRLRQTQHGTASSITSRSTLRNHDSAIPVSTRSHHATRHDDLNVLARVACSRHVLGFVASANTSSAKKDTPDRSARETVRSLSNASRFRPA